jgi:hypothetical protein
MAEGSPRDNRQILGELSELVIDGPERAEQGTRLVAELATRQPWIAPVLQLGPSAWREHVSTVATTGPMGGSWLRDFDATMEVVFELYESDYGSARRTLHELNAEDPRIPYLRLLLMHAIFELGLADPREVARRRTLARAIRALLGDDARLLAWVRQKRTAGVLLKALGGMTHTVLGMYDWTLAAPGTGFVRRDRRAEAGYDLGGGFGTPDLTRLLGQPLVSLDLQGPGEARRLGIERFQVASPARRPELLPRRVRWQDDAEAAAYLLALERQPWQRFDVFTDAFDESVRSYLITSFGFLTSTVASHSPHALSREALGGNVLAQMHTTLTGLSRVLRLVALGKDVTLLTYQRATSRAYRNATLFLRFVQHRLADAAAFELPFQLTGAGNLPPLRASSRRAAGATRP